MGHADRHEGPDGRADPAGGGAKGRSCADVSERLEALERSLQSVVDEITATRRTLGELFPAAAADLGGEATGARAPEQRGPRSGGAARASMRDGPLDVLFRSTVTGGGGDPVARETFVAPDLGDDARAADGSPAAAPALGPATDEAACSWLEPGAVEIDPLRAGMVANRERLLGPEHPDTLWAAHDLALALADEGEIALAWRLATRVLEVRTRALGAEHPYSVRASELQLAIAGMPERISSG